MKRYLITGAVVAALAVLLFFWARPGGDASAPNISKPPPEALAVTNSSEHSNAVNPERSRATADIESVARIEAERQYLASRADEIRASNEAGNPSISFYGLAVDQDTNPLPNVSVDLAVIEEYLEPSLQVKTKTTPLRRQTGTDGRFEVSGLKGKYVVIYTLTKEGYEPENPGQAYGMFGAQISGFVNPVVLRMWSTNLHEPLVTGDKSFVIIPDGRHYSVDLIKGTIAEADGGDLVTWIKRPQKVDRGQRYDWSCEVAIPGGGLLESQGQTMFIAPEVGYTNAFACEEQANPDRWSGATGDKRFYVRLRNGEMYGRILVNLYADYRGKQLVLIRVSYAVNPSGSRLLR